MQIPKSQCDFCENLMIYPKSEIERIIDINALVIKKTSLTTIKLLIRISDEAFFYLVNNYPELFLKIMEEKQLTCPPTLDAKIVLINQFLHYKKSSHLDSFIKCGVCNKEACSFHLEHGKFTFLKCNKCDKTNVVCGWCSEELYNRDHCYFCNNRHDYIYV